MTPEETEEIAKEKEEKEAKDKRNTNLAMIGGSALQTIPGLYNIFFNKLSPTKSTSYGNELANSVKRSSPAVAYSTNAGNRRARGDKAITKRQLTEINKIAQAQMQKARRMAGGDARQLREYMRDIATTKYTAIDDAYKTESQRKAQDRAVLTQAREAQANRDQSVILANQNADNMERSDYTKSKLAALTAGTQLDNQNNQLNSQINAHNSGTIASGISQIAMAGKDYATGYVANKNNEKDRDSKMALAKIAQDNLTGANKDKVSTALYNTGELNSNGISTGYFKNFLSPNRKMIYTTPSTKIKMPKKKTGYSRFSTYGQR